MKQFKVWKTVELGAPIIINGCGLWYGEYGKEPQQVDLSATFATCGNCQYYLTSKCKGKEYCAICRHSIKYTITKLNNGCYQRRYQNFNEAINEAGKVSTRIHTKNYAQKILLNPAFTVNTNRQKIDLVYACVTDLNLSGAGEKIEKIYTRAKEYGLELCPAEVGPRLYLQLINYGWSWPGRFSIGMEPIEVDGMQYLFAMNDGDPYRTFFGMDASLNFDNYYFFVFVLPHPLKDEEVV